MLYDFLIGWFSWLSVCLIWFWVATRRVRSNKNSEMHRVDYTIEVFVLSMSLSVGGAALLYICYDSIAGGEETAPRPVHLFSILGALVAFYLGMRTVPRWGDRLAKPAHLDD